MKKKMSCVICSETTNYVEHMQKHLKDLIHTESIREFRATLEYY
jgi:hypothetical protein